MLRTFCFARRTLMAVASLRPEMINGRLDHFAGGDGSSRSGAGDTRKLQGLHWLLNCAGKEANWFWKWKFGTADRHVVSTQTSMAGHGSRIRSAGCVPPHSRYLPLNQIPCSWRWSGNKSFPGSIVVLSAHGSRMPWRRRGMPVTAVVYGSPLHRTPMIRRFALLALRDRAAGPSLVQRLRRLLGAHCPRPYGRLAVSHGDPGSRRSHVGRLLRFAAFAGCSS